MGLNLDLGSALGISLKPMVSRELGTSVAGTTGSGRDPEVWEKCDINWVKLLGAL